MDLVIIAAISKNNVIGKDGLIPWHISEDLLRFKALTMTYPIIMGRKTYESLPVKPLKGRTNIILTSSELSTDGAVVKRTLEEALDYCKELKAEKAFVIGGASVYKEAVGQANTMEITLVDKVYDGDVFFPEVNWDDWQVVSEDKKDGYTFVTYKRNKTAA